MTTQIPKCTAADGKTEVFGFHGHPLMVSAPEYNALHSRLLSAESALKLALDAIEEKHGWNVASRINAIVTIRKHFKLGDEL